MTDSTDLPVFYLTIKANARYDCQTFAKDCKPTVRICHGACVSCRLSLDSLLVRLPFQIEAPVMTPNGVDFSFSFVFFSFLFYIFWFSYLNSVLL